MPAASFSITDLRRWATRLMPTFLLFVFLTCWIFRIEAFPLTAIRLFPYMEAKRDNIEDMEFWVKFRDSTLEPVNLKEVFFLSTINSRYQVVWNKSEEPARATFIKNLEHLLQKQYPSRKLEYIQVRHLEYRIQDHQGKSVEIKPVYVKELKYDSYKLTSSAAPL
jgi:hypothetical protein